MSLRPRTLLASFACLLASALPACSPPEPSLPNVILVTLDTVRADHLSCYGYEHPTSPRLDALAAESDFYKRAYSTAPWTLPSHASMFTGLFPFQHNARTIRVESQRSNVLPLSEKHTTLAEFLGAEGYATAGFVANAGFLQEAFRVHQGFEVYDVERKGGMAITRKAREWLARRQDERPFFLFVNYMDAHRPYHAMRYNQHLPKPTRKESSQLLDELISVVMGSDAPVPEDLVEEIVRLYDYGISNADLALGKLLDDLQKFGLSEDTLVIVTSDHGEFLGEHRLVEHSKDVYEEVLRVPLVVHRPGQREGRVIDDLACSVDIPSFVLDELPEEIAERGLELFPYRPGNHPVLAENYYTRTKDLFHPVWGDRFQRARFAIYTEKYKYIHSTDGENELFNLLEDPLEQHNLCDDQLDLVARFVKVLRSFRTRAPMEQRDEEVPPELSPEELEELKALGYL